MIDIRFGDIQKLKKPLMFGWLAALEIGVPLGQGFLAESRGTEQACPALAVHWVLLFEEPGLVDQLHDQLLPSAQVAHLLRNAAKLLLQRRRRFALRGFPAPKIADAFQAQASLTV